MDVGFQPSTNLVEAPTTGPLERHTGGAVAIEYALLAALIAMAIIVGLVALGDSIRNLPLQAIIDAIIGR
jgi:Flp pilus assembly pilin Flp